ncbi:MAG: SDR family NAD(P)-dependent oxidoreductase, partial [Elusimicrobia bacterium]
IVHQRAVVPGAFYLSVLLAVAADRLRASTITLRDIEFVRPLITDDSIRVQVRLAADNQFTVASDVTHLQGRLEVGVAPAAVLADVDFARVKQQCTEPVPVDAAYTVLQSLSIAWGPAWRWMTHAYRGPAGALVRLVPPAQGQDRQAPLHPCLIDNGFGAGVLASLGETAAETAEPSLPYAITEFRLHRAVTGPVWCLCQRRPSAGSSELVRFDLVFWDDAGALVAEIQGFAVKRAPKQAFFASAGHGSPPLFGLCYRPAPLAQKVDRLGRVGLFCGPFSEPASIPAWLSAAVPGLVTAPQDSAQLAAWLDGMALDVLVCTWDVPASATALDAIATAHAAAGLWVLQAVLHSRSKPRRLLWLTASATALDEGSRIDPAPSTLWGLGRVAAQEHPELGLRLIDLHGLAQPDDLADLMRRLLDELAADDDEPQLALSARGRFALRLDRLPPAEQDLARPDSPSYRLICDGSGGWKGLRLAATARQPPAAQQVEVEVEAAGLNFRDVVNVLGMVGDLGPLGGEVAGVVTAVGEDVQHLRVGDAVMGLVPGGFAKYVTTDARWLVARPAAQTPEQAAAWPVVFLSAWIALRVIADIRPGERVLIHSAAGGVGMAAIQLAQRFGAEVYATASPSKWHAVQALGVKHLASSRTLDFVSEFRAAGGVDVVLNTLAGEFVDASLSLLRPGGRFIELGKTDIRDPQAVERSFPGTRYQAFDLAQIALTDPSAIQTMLCELQRGLTSNELTALPLRTWPIARARQAFEHMGRAGHIGKIVLVPEVERRSRIRSDGTALITGGLGALGLEVARWLVHSQHLRHVILVSRRANADEALATLAELRAAGATIEIAAVDVADAEALGRLLAGLPSDRPLRAVIHAAGVLDDGVLLDQTAERFSAVLAPKVAGAWNLHRLTETLDLDAFVLFSSSAGWFGSPGQSSYAAANTFLDALAAHRRQRGLAATSIAWGAWVAATRTQGLGMTARLSAAERARLVHSGLGAVHPTLGLALLAAALDRDSAVVSGFPLDVDKLTAALGTATPPLLRGLLGDAQRPQHTAPAEGLAALAPAERLVRVQTWIAEEVSRVMRVGKVPLDQPLKERGLVSLMAVEVRNGVAARIGKPLPVTVLFDHPTIAGLSRYVVDEVLKLEAKAESSAAAPASAASWSEPIAIIGMGCRFPGDAVDPDSLWQLLLNRVDAIGEVPRERWDVDAYFDPNPDAAGKMYTRWGGFLPQIDRFDAGFFGISGREARSVDPQERLMLEVSWEALERARLTTDALMDSATGVYMGVCSHEYSVLALSDAAAIDAYSGLGTAHSAMVGRISYCLGLRGPNLAIDTACSSSLVAVHLACQALRAGECSLALAGGVNTILFPEGTVYFSRLRAMSPTGRCRPFSAAADGSVRSEGVGVVVLERLSDAQAKGRHILAVIRGTAVNQDGRSQGLTAPSGPAQQAVIRRALENAGVAPSQVDYVECHGTGTPLGDPIELHALATAYGDGRLPENRLAIGSVKSNLGHTEGAAGIAGLIKAVLLLERGRLPASLHAETLSPHVPWDLVPLDVVREPRDWPQRAWPRRAGVSAFGFSGTNAHVILEQAPSVDRPAPINAAGPATLMISAKSLSALRGQAAKLASHLASATEVALPAVARALRTERSQFWHRLAIDTADRSEAAARLALFAREGRAAGVWAGEAREGSADVAFLYTGQGAQYATMGRALYEHEPIFRAALDRCAALFAQELPLDLIALLYENTASLHETACAQPALFAIQYAQGELWQHWGITPAMVLGHSIGEYAAAQRAGVFSLADAVRLVAARGRLMQALPVRGAMVMLGAPEARVLAALAPLRDRAAIAAVNGPDQVVISGDEAAVLGVAETFAAAGVRTRRLRVSHAFHSPLMAPMLDAFQTVARTVRYSPPKIALVSTAVGQVATAEYWVEHVRAPVRFYEGLRSLVDAGVRRFVELGPAPILSSLGAESFPDAGCTWLASLREDRPDARLIRESAARLWISGVPVAWRDDDAVRVHPVNLPTYAFERERYWIDGRPAALSQPSAAHASEPTPLTHPAVTAVDASRLSPAELSTWIRREVAVTCGATDDSAISPSRDLFEQGFDSLLLVELRSRLAAGLGQTIPMEVLFRQRTVAALTAYLVEERARGAATSGGSGLIVPLARSPLLFLLPGALGGAMDFFYLSQRLMPEWTVLGLDYPGISGGVFHTDIRTLAAALADHIAHFAGDAPIVLGGHSFGGGVAWEVCHELISRGRTVELVLMFDTFCPLGMDGYAEPDQAVYVERLQRLSTLRALYAANARIAKNWRQVSVLPDSVRVVLFKVSDKDSDAMKTATVDDPRDLWADYAAIGSYAIEAVSGTHGDFIVRSPEVDEVARRVRAQLVAVCERMAARTARSQYSPPPPANSPKDSLVQDASRPLPGL